MANQPRAAARNEHVYDAVQFHKGIRCAALCRANDADCLARHIARRQSVAQYIGQGFVGMNCLRAAAQHASVARLQANARRVNGHVRTRLIHHGNHAQRNAHARNMHAALDRALFEHAPYRVGQCRQIFQGVRHRGNAAFVEHETVEKPF